MLLKQIKSPTRDPITLRFALLCIATGWVASWGVIGLFAGFWNIFVIIGVIVGGTTVLGAWIYTEINAADHEVNHTPIGREIALFVLGFMARLLPAIAITYQVSQSPWMYREVRSSPVWNVVYHIVLIPEKKHHEEQIIETAASVDKQRSNIDPFTGVSHHWNEREMRRESLGPAGIPADVVYDPTNGVFSVGVIPTTRSYRAN